MRAPVIGQHDTRGPPLRRRRHATRRHRNRRALGGQREERHDEEEEGLRWELHFGLYVDGWYDER